MLLLFDRADQEGLGDFLSARLPISDAEVLIFLLLNGSELAVALVGDFVGDAELALANLLNHVELRVEDVALGPRLRHHTLLTRAEDELVGTGSRLDTNVWNFLKSHR